MKSISSECSCANATRRFIRWSCTCKTFSTSCTSTASTYRLCEAWCNIARHEKSPEARASGLSFCLTAGLCDVTSLVLQIATLSVVTLHSGGILVPAVLAILLALTHCLTGAGIGHLSDSLVDTR